MSIKNVLHKDALTGIQELKVLQAFLNDYKARLHVRKIAELLKMSHSTVALALLRLEKNRVLWHEIAGRNKNYFLNMDNILTKGILANAENMRTAKIEEKYFIIKKMISELFLEKHDIIKNYCIVLFGSYAKGDADEESDIDLLLIGKEDKNVTNWFREFAARHNKEAHVHYYTYDGFEKALKKRDALAKEIVAGHAVLNNPYVFIEIIWRYFYE